MHKIVVGVQNEADLINLSKQLTLDEIRHKLWTEQPENYPTCLATKPYAKSRLENYFKAFKLFK